MTGGGYYFPSPLPVTALIMLTIKDLIGQKKPDFEKILNFYKSEIAAIRTNRATPALVEDIEVDYYSQRLKIKELGSVTVPEPRTIVIQPWDKGALEAIGGAISQSGVGLNPVNDGNTIRLNLPPLTEERRKEFIKLLKQKAEDAKIKIRRTREELWNKIQHLERERQIREDDKFWAKEELQKIVDEFNQKVEDMEKKKESELLA